MVAQNIFFYVIAAGMVGAAVAVVTTRNVVRAALYLIAVFAGVAAQFILLAAEFVAVTQILIYIGAIMVLMLFGIMLTRARIGRDVDMTNDHWWVGVGTALLLAEQNVWFARQSTSRVMLLDSGSLVFSGTWDEFDAAGDLVERYLAV